MGSKKCLAVAPNTITSGMLTGQCRSRKSKCGAMPPDPCSNCIEAGIGCTWPAEDGRSSRARMERKARLSSNPAHASSSTMGDVKPTIPTQQRHASHSSNGGANQQSTGAEDGESVWLDQLLSSGMMPPRQGEFPKACLHLEYVAER